MFDMRHLHSSWERLPLILKIKHLAAESWRQFNNRVLPRWPSSKVLPLLAVSSTPRNICVSKLKGTAAAQTQPSFPSLRVLLAPHTSDNTPHDCVIILLCTSLNYSYKAT